LWYQYAKGRITKDELRTKRFRDTFAHFDVKSEELTSKMADGYINLSPYQTRLFPNALETLTALKEDNFELHIITNGFKEVQFIKLEKSKLAPFFATVTSSEEVGVKKPNPLVFNTALSKAGASAKLSIMIGDTFDADILGAEGVGMDTIFFNYRKEIPKNGYKVVDYLLEIKDLL